MEQPTHDLRAHIPSTVEGTSTRSVSLLVVVGIHIGLAFALIAGLKAGLIEKLPEELKAEVVQPKDDVKPPPPPPPDLAKPPPPFVPPPEINIATDAPVTNAITAVQAVAPTPPAPVQAPVVTPSKAVGRTHDCQSYYPPLAAKLNETGNVLIHYDVGADGSISNVGIVKSSGSDRLDQAAVNCVSSKWRNTPAMQGDTPVATPGHQAIIQFKLN
ncbi:MAG: energy transducer TonB [Rhizomicrobium sp.]